MLHNLIFCIQILYLHFDTITLDSGRLRECRDHNQLGHDDSALCQVNQKLNSKADIFSIWIAISHKPCHETLSRDEEAS